MGASSRDVSRPGAGSAAGLLQERGEGVFPLEAIHDQVSSVVPSGVEGASAVDGCTRSLGGGGMEAPGAQEVARFPSVSVPVCLHERGEMRAATHA